MLENIRGVENMCQMVATDQRKLNDSINKFIIDIEDTKLKTIYTRTDSVTRKKL